MGRKQKKKQNLGGGQGDLVTRTSTATATLEREPVSENILTAAWKAWGGKSGNSASGTQKRVADSPSNSLKLPHRDGKSAPAAADHPGQPFANLAPTLDPRLDPRQDPSVLEQEPLAKKQDSKKQTVAEARQPAPPPARQEPPANKGGFFKRLFGGPERSADNGGEDDSGSLITLFTGRVKPSPVAEPARPEPARAEAVKPAAAATPKPAPETAAREENLQKLGELERLREENAALKKKLEDERQVAQKQLGQLEIQNNEFRATAEKARGEKGDVEARTAVLRKSVSALERQLAEERERFSKEMEQATRQRDTLLQDIAELNEKVVKLDTELESLTASNARTTSTGLSTEIGASHAHISRLESLVQRLEDEVELLQRELSTEKEKFRRNNDEWEQKLKDQVQAASHASVERNRMEDSAGMVQAAMEALQQQVREQHEAMEVQMKLLESERTGSRAKSAEYEQKLKALEAQLEAEKSRRSPEDDADTTLTRMETALSETRTHSAQAEARIALLEGELEAARNQVLREAEASAARIRKFQERWQEIEQQILPKDEELRQLRPQVGELQGKVTALEAELKSAKAAVARLAASAEGDGSTRTISGTNDPTFAQAGVRLPAEIAEPFYHQSMAPITVMLACADILGMSRKLDPSLKSTAEEFKTQTQALLDLIKSYTLPPDAKTN